MNRTLIRVAMGTAAIMLAHQVAAKALRDAAFLSAWPATALPLMTIGTAIFTGCLVPVFSRLLVRFSPLSVVAVGFALSAAGHALEWLWFDAGRWTAVVIYLHLAGVGAVLLSGFWSLIAERFDPTGARAAYGRIAATGTAGGLAGSIVAERIASTASPAAVLVMLAGLHVLCSLGLLMFRGAPALLTRPSQPEGPSAIRDSLRSPYLKTIASFVVLTSAASAIADFLLKSNVRSAFGTGPELLRFFSVYYGSIQILSFIAQTRSTSALQRFGIDGAIASLPGGVAAASALALAVPVWPLIVLLRAIDAVLHNSFFRSGYELLFVPMDPATRRRAKTTLDVVCDRAGEAAGSALVQLIVLAGVFSLRPTLLIVTLVLGFAGFWLGRRFGPLYLRLVEHELVKYRDAPQFSLVSEAGWTLLRLPDAPAADSLPAAPRVAPTPPVDPLIGTLTDLRSRDAARVTAALATVSTFAPIHVAQTIDLLAWDAVMPAARTALEQVAANHLGMLIDALVSTGSDFAVRRRLPRILGTVTSRRSLDGLMLGLDDARFEVRYHSSRAMSRVIAKNPVLTVDSARVIAIVERELSVPPQRWRGYKLLDRPDLEGPADVTDSRENSSTYLHYLIALLSTIVAREPLDAAVQGVRSPDAGVRGLAREYLEQVLPPVVLDRLSGLLVATSSDVDVHGQSAEPQAATQP